MLKKFLCLKLLVLIKDIENNIDKWNIVLFLRLEEWKLLKCL